MAFIETFTEREIQDGIYERAINRAAACDGSRVQMVPLSKAGEYVWNLQKTGALTSETDGDETTWFLFGAALCKVTRKYSSRRIRLHYPELKPEIWRSKLIDPTNYVEVWFMNEWHAALYEKGVMTWRANGVQWKVNNEEETMEVKYENAEFDIIRMERGKKVRETVSGYTFDVELPSGFAVTFGVDKRQGARQEIAWKVTDLESGIMICEDKSRAKAVSKLATVKTAGKTYLELYEELLGSSKYVNFVDDFKNLAKTVEAKVKDKTGAEVKATVVEPEDGIGAVIIEPRREVPKAPEPPKDDDIEIIDETENVAVEVTVETLRALVEGHNVVVTQKNERSCIWVMGDTKPLKEELKSAGLRWAPGKKAWWYKPAAA